MHQYYLYKREVPLPEDLEKKGKIKKYKQYEYSAITENKSHTYLGLGE